MKARFILSYQTSAGKFFIAQSEDGRFHPIYNNESVGSYEYAWQATEDLSMGVTHSILHQETDEYLEVSELGIPEDPSEWEQI